MVRTRSDPLGMRGTTMEPGKGASATTMVGLTNESTHQCGNLPVSYRPNGIEGCIM